jgi:hypothetical protein
MTLTQGHPYLRNNDVYFMFHYILYVYCSIQFDVVNRCYISTFRLYLKNSPGHGMKGIFPSAVSVLMSILADPSWTRQPPEAIGMIPFGTYTPFLILSISWFAREVRYRLTSSYELQNPCGVMFQ